MEQDDSRVVHVEIHGQQYPIRSGLDPVYVAELAAYVDEKMRAAARESTAGDTLKIAVLAALNIADECFRAQANDRHRGQSLTLRDATGAATGSITYACVMTGMISRFVDFRSDSQITRKSLA